VSKLFKAKVRWCMEDIRDRAEELGLSLTDDEATDILYDLEEDIIDRMIQAGWDVIADRIYTILESRGAGDGHNA